MSRWTTMAAIAALTFLFPLQSQTFAQGTDAGADLPRKIELKPGAEADATKTAQGGGETPAVEDKTRQLAVEPKAEGDKTAGETTPKAEEKAAPAEAPKSDTPAAPAAETPAPDATPSAPAEGAPAPTEQAAPTPAGVEDVVVAVQTELKRVGCDPGEIDGIWGGHSREALAAFGHFAKVEVGDLKPTPEILGVIKGKAEIVCTTPPPADGYGGGYDGGYGGYGGY